MKRRTVLVIFVLTLGLIAARQAVAWLAPDSTFAGILTGLLVVCIVVLALSSLRWLWRRMTYRVEARLFWSYLLIGVVPVLICLVLGAALGYLLVGQYTSVQYGTRLERLVEQMAERGREAMEVLSTSGLRPAGEVLDGGELFPGHPGYEWLIVDGSAELSSPGAAGLGPPSWAGEGAWDGPVTAGNRSFRAVILRDGQRLVAVLLPLTPATAEALSRGQWYEVSFMADGEAVASTTSDGRGVTVDLDESTGQPPVDRNDTSQSATEGAAASPSMGPEPVAEEVADGSPAGVLDRVLVVWFRLGREVTSWNDGETSGRRVASLLKTSPAAAWADLLRSPYELQAGMRTVLLSLGGLSALVYVLIVGLAVIQIVAIARSTARLTRGAREVGSGNLAYRIPVKRRDQLGDLAVSFNRMAESVGHMLDEVAEKERMAGELELAREIQEALLPPSSLHHGELAVYAHFRPAAAVGGDYFDVFPMEDERLVVTVGDVAGHGLPTGLMMAMVKAAVAALVHEGHTGRELLEHLNHLIREHPRRHRMATFLLAEIDASRWEVALTSAGHPPAFLVQPDGDVEEILLSALPLGRQWRMPPADASRRLPPGGRLVLYSDGLVEAENADGQAYSYEGLRSSIQKHAALPPGALVGALLADLDRHLEGGSLGDDLTLVVVERGAAAAT